MGRTVYIGRYKVIEELGRGGMGIVYRGEDPVLERPVAIKVLPPKKTAQKKAVQRFLREARVSARLDHPHIVKIYDIGEEDGIYHIVMEYVEGDSLRELIEETPQDNINIKDMCVLFTQLCNALSYAHEQKITHRDIKPENIKITPDHKVKLMDFGIAVLGDNHSITEAGSVMGTIAYFSPEQARGGEVDYRADIYSLGVVFYEMLTQHLPFEANSISEMIHKHLHAAPTPPRDYNPEIHPEIEKLILRCLEKEPNRRFTSASIPEEIVNSYLNGAYDKKEEPIVEEPEESGKDYLNIDMINELRAQFKYNAPEPSSDTVYKVPSPTLEPESEPKPYTENLNYIKSSIKPIANSQQLASDEWLSQTASSNESTRYREFLDKVKKDAIINSETILEESSSSVICPECGQENCFGQLECTKCGADLKKAHFAGSRGARAYNTQGLEYLTSGDIKQAIVSFDEAIKCDPKFYEAHINLAKAYLANGEPDTALERLEVTAAEFPGHSNTYSMKAECYRRKDLPQEAIEEYRKAIRLDPNNCEARFQLAFLYTNRGELSNAITEYRYVLALEPDNVDVHKQLGYIYAGIDRIDDAISEFEYVLKFDPNNGSVHSWLGDLYKKKRRFAQAEKSYHTAISINPDESSNINALADLYMQQNKDDLAYKTYKEAVKKDSNLDAHLNIADIYMKYSDPKNAIKELEVASISYPDNSELHRKLGDIYMSVDNYSEALEHYEKSVTEDSNPDLHNRLGLLYLKKDYNKLSIMEYQKAVEMQPGSAEYREDLGMAYYCQGDKESAIEELKKAAVLDSRNVDYLKAIAVMMEEEGRFDEAIKTLNKAKFLSPRDSMIPALIGKVYFTQGLISMAIVEYQKALELQPTNYLYHIYIARAYSKKGQSDKAIASFRSAINLMPDRHAVGYDAVMSRAYIDLGRAHIAKGEYAKAREILLSAEKSGSKDKDLYLLLGIACLNDKKVQEAYNYLSTALAAAPDNDEIASHMIKCLSLKGDYDSAIKLCKKLLENNPDKKELIEEMVDTYISADLISDAKKFVKSKIDSSPEDQPYFHFLLAKIAKSRRDILAIDKELNLAVQMDPNNWYYAKDYALYLKSRDEDAKAIEMFKLALKNAPEEEFAQIASEIEALQTRMSR